MRKVIFVTEEKNKPTEKPIRLSSRKQTDGWHYLTVGECEKYMSRAEKIVYLGKCLQDGDMFALYSKDGYIMIFKGQLNSGLY